MIDPDAPMNASLFLHLAHPARCPPGCGGVLSALPGWAAAPLARRLLLVVAMLLLWPAATQAQGTPEARRHFNVAAGPLEEALNRFARQAGITMSYASALVQGRQVTALQGEYSVRQGLEVLLAGSGLRAVRSDKGAYALQPLVQGAPEQVDTLHRLGNITVSGRRDEPGAFDPVEGYVALRSATATKTDTPLLELAQSVSVVTRAEMEARGANSILDVLRYMPGANTETHGVDPRGYDYFNLRGFINAQTTSNYLNGLRQIPSGFGMFRTETYGLERVEVLRGANSASFGQADPGGVINRVSKLAGSGARNELTVDVGSFQRRQVAADLSGELDPEGRVQARIVGLLLDGDTQFRYANGRAGDNDRLYLAPSLKIRPSADTSLILLAEYLKDRSGSGRWTAVRADGSQTHTLLGDPDFDQQRGEQWSLGWMLEHRLDATWTLRQHFRQAALRSQYAAVNPGSFNGSLLSRSTAVYDTQVENTLLDNQALARFQWGQAEHQVLLGLDWSHMSAREQRYRGVAPSLDIDNPVYTQPIPAATTRFGDLDQTLVQTGLYAQDQIRYQRIVLTLGARYDRSRDSTRNAANNSLQAADENAFSGRVGLSYLVSPELAPYVSYGSSFLPQAGQDVDGKPFKAATARQIEAGVKYQPDHGRAVYTAALYQLVKDNALGSDPLHANFSVSNGQIRSRGVELEAKGELLPGLNVTAAYTYAQVVNTQNAAPELIGKTPILVPRQAASLWLDYTVQRGDLAGMGVGAGARYTGRNYATAANTVENAAQVILDAMVRIDRGPWRYAFNVSNLANRQYTSCLAEPTLTCFWAPERTAVLSARYRW